MNSKNKLKQKLCDMEEGRFSSLINSMSSFSDTCFECKYFESKNKSQYLCAVLGYCPGVTLSENVKEYFIKKLKEIK